MRALLCSVSSLDAVEMLILIKYWLQMLEKYVILLDMTRCSVENHCWKHRDTWMGAWDMGWIWSRIGSAIASA
jgi:hypothetical protein